MFQDGVWGLIFNGDWALQDTIATQYHNIMQQTPSDAE